MTRDHPRIRGEHELDRQAHLQDAGIIPAYAGSTSPTWPTARSRRGSSPHTRGARRRHLRYIPLRYGSSPHTRGAPARSLRRTASTWDHPRIRGEHRHREPGSDDVPGIIPAYAGSTVWLMARAALREGSSPHTRGAHHHDVVPDGVVVDHPRIRGEHRSLHGEELGNGGSSPHTRGARQP